MAPAAVELWPDNVAAVMVLTRMVSQWRAGAGGLIGMDYTALPVVFRLTGVPRADWPDLFEDIRVLENAALKEMYDE